MQDIVLASSYPGKVREINQLLAELELQVPFNLIGQTIFLVNG